ncbi:type IX secretion system outer membrane channel protein PorV [Carboxylicivirga sp. N1Y90]|uniref:type IX secretion system outer membrane channel protein PorV n=1 Tax=Carboxylicivirga fragile TaxID=3417571 RepID=UPI003D355DB3|nr:type IX secretion system outer membrane channel protein PorV [Marinilabiliaceae bacterium N1Y90]
MKKSIGLKVGALLLSLFLSQLSLLAQDDGQVVNTAAPFLNIMPESRAGGMGDAGVATSPDMNSQALNPAKYAFIDSDMGVSLSFTPWLRKLVNDINMYYTSFYYRIDKMSTVSASLRYFSMGSITFNDEQGNTLATGNPNEFALDAAYSRALSKKLSGAVAFRYIRSDISNGYSDGGNIQAGDAFAADVAFYFKTPVKIDRNDAEFSAGINLSNLGSKMSYDGVNKMSLPTNLKLGVGWFMELDKYNSVSFALDGNRLLTPAIENINEDGTEGEKASELNKITFSLGAEYWYDKQFAIRAGYFHEDESLGNRKFASAGAGLKFNMFQLDASYIIPLVQNNPLANTMRFTLSFDLSEMSGGRKRR